MATAAYFIDELSGRLHDLREWFAAALEVFELRDGAGVAAAKDVYLRWATLNWDGGSHSDEALAHAWTLHTESAVTWVENDHLFMKDFPLPEHPSWEQSEVYLVAGAFFADRAIDGLERGTNKGFAIAAMMYADAIDARESWMRFRGPAKCRNQDTKLGEIVHLVRQLDDAIAVRVAKREAAKAHAQIKLARDPKQAARVKAKELWLDWQVGRQQFANQAAFARYVCETYGLKDASNVEKWCREWRKEGKGG